VEHIFFICICRRVGPRRHSCTGTIFDRLNKLQCFISKIGEKPGYTDVTPHDDLMLCRHCDEFLVNAEIFEI